MTDQSRWRSERMSSLVAMRAAIRSADLAGLGVGFPDDEYQSLSDRAFSTYVRTRSILGAVDQVEIELREGWGIAIGARDRKTLVNALQQWELEEFSPSE